MKRKNVAVTSVFVIAGGALPGGVSALRGEHQAVIAPRRETQADDPHTHVDQADGCHIVQQTIAGLGGNRSSVPFIDSSVMDAANIVAIRARHDFSMAAHRVAALWAA